MWLCGWVDGLLFFLFFLSEWLAVRSPHRIGESAPIRGPAISRVLSEGQQVAARIESGFDP